ncbi:MAG: fibronectin type III domain-containing protein [Clostridiales Family XIII bacterium]|nr:fibronectin type III domain-containing protein [Clostridiales Family XIII bacterium]
MNRVGNRSLRVVSAALVAVAVIAGAWFLPLGTPAGLAEGTAHAAVLGDDYPEKWKILPIDAAFDDWGMYTRECTSFVAWRLASANGYAVNRAGKSWNANLWGPNAVALGVTVDMTPAVGSVAWWDVGFHVAWVADVSGDLVTIEEYNYPGNSGNYNCRTIAKTSVDGYIHFKDIGAAAPPSAGTDFISPVDTGNQAGPNNNGADTAVIQAPPAPEKVQKPLNVELTAKRSSLKVRWTKPAKAAAQQVTGYQIRYRYKKGASWSGWRTNTYQISCASKAKTASKTLKGLKSGKVYQIRIRTYKSAGAESYYSTWTNPITSGRIG